MLSRAFAALLIALASILPRRMVYAIAEAIGAALFRLPRMRRDLLDNARHILGSGSTGSDRAALGRAVLRNFGRSVADLILAHRLWRGGAASLDELPIEIEGRERFERALALGRGLIAVSLHLGSYEIGSMVIARRSGGAAIVYHRDPAAFFERLRSRQRRLTALDEIPIDASRFFGIEALRRLREGGTILIAGEVAAAPRGEPFSFLDGTAGFSPWPARLAASSGAPLLPAFTVRRPDGGYRVLIEEPIEAEPSGDPRAITERLVRIFERIVRAHPEQWLMVRRFWAD